MLTLLATTLLAVTSSPPLAIDFWYGPDRVFAELGRPQAQINILGNVFADAGVDRLFYSLDGGAELPISVGPDLRRLQSAGDFNIELFLDEVDAGEHQVIVRAIDNDANEITGTYDFTIAEERVWPLPFTAHWVTAYDVTSVSQPVDGNWIIQDGGVRCPTPGYDRLVAIGDTTWTDYEVTVPITIHAVDPNGYLPPSNTPGVGILVRWNGHTDFVDPGSQPNIGYYPQGGALEYAYHVDQCGARLQLYGNPFDLRDQDDTCSPIEFDVPYVWKFRVQTLGNGKHEYKGKVWEQGLPEPPGWDLTMLEDAAQPSHGCVLLLAHHVDATFGDVQVTAIGGPPAVIPPFTTIRSRAKLYGDDIRTGKVIYREIIRDGALLRRFYAIVRNGEPGEIHAVRINNDLVGLIEVGQDGVGKLDMRSYAFIDDPDTQQPLPNSFPPIVDLENTTVGPMSGVFYDAIYTLPEGSAMESPQYRVMREFDDPGTGMNGKVIYRERIKNGALDRKLIVHVFDGEPNTFRWFRINDEKVERVYFDRHGFGRLEMRTSAFIENPGVELPMSNAIPTLLPGQIVRVGPVSIELQE